MAFDPFTNEEVAEIAGIEMKAGKWCNYYQLPIICLLKTKESIDTLEKCAASLSNVG